MSIWKYSDEVQDRALVSRGLKLKSCPFCETKLEKINIPGGVDSEGMLSARTLKVCLMCGWWEMIYEAYANIDNNSVSEVRGGEWGAIAILRNLDISDVSIPISEIRKFLIAKFDVRHEIHPRLFEETVASVFRNFGYRAKVTAYSGDGGIDVVLEDKNNEEIGVQVKRYKETIQVEQIRAFTGALLLGGYTKGVFVTTSRFAAGAHKVATSAALRGIQIDLLDAPSFYEALGIAQIEHSDLVNEVSIGIRNQSLMLLKKHFY